MALLTAVQSANPANEAEVETKLLLHIFRLLGYTDTDRADKRPVTMSFGRERKTKAADFIIYDGSDRTAANALIAVEAKSPGEPLADAEDQVKSYALWAGTPFYMACNGEELLVATFLPGADASQRRTVRIPELLRDWNILEGLLSRSAVVLEKERLVYKAFYLPGVETLPASDFFREYLERLQSRFTALHTELTALTAPRSGEGALPLIPVNVRLPGVDEDVNSEDLAAILIKRTSRIFVEGAPGSGKTTLTRRVTLNLAHDALTPGSRLIPILVTLRSGVPNTIEEALQRACVDMGVRVFPALYRKALERAHVVLVLDGLDEVLDADTVMIVITCSADRDRSSDQSDGTRLSLIYVLLASG